jgi:hypothetical protein
MKSIRRNELATLIIFLAIILGAFVRFSTTSLAGFAINDGGMFAVMVEDLKTSGYALPVFTSYNGLNIPYAYPPLGFYFGRIASDLSGLPPVEIMRWLPAFFASLSVIAFYLLASRLMKTRFHAALAALIFALMPRAMSWFVMGGGLTRSPGQFFMLLTLASVVRLYKENRRIDIFWAGLFGALAVLSHPEAAVYTAFSALFLWLMLGRTRRSFLNSIPVAALVLVLTAPWWVTVISRHGLTPILSAAQTGQKLLAIFHLVFFSFSEEIYATPIAILGLIGLGLCITRRDYLLPLWLIFPFFVEGRSAAGPAAVPLAMLAASGFVDIVLAGLRSAKGEDAPLEQVTSIERGVLLYFFMYLLFSGYLFSWQISNATLYPPDREAMQWVSQNTPADASFLVLTGSRSVSCDSVPEWFPALAQRQSVFTVQGTEWTLGKDFGDFVQKAGAVQACVSDSLNCVMDLTKSVNYDFIYVSKILRVDNCSPLSYPQTFPFFVEALRSNPGFEIVYETKEVAVFRNR